MERMPLATRISTESVLIRAAEGIRSIRVPPEEVKVP
jgi:hypothetical protein